MGILTEFHIVPHNFVIEQDGLLESEFFTKNAAEINYSENCLIINGKKYRFINNVAKISPRERKVICVQLKNTHLKEWFIPKYNIEEGVFPQGNCIVKNYNNKAYLPLINTTEKEIFVNLPMIELEKVEYLSNPNPNFTISSSNNFSSQFSNCTKSSILRLNLVFL